MHSDNLAKQEKKTLVDERLFNPLKTDYEKSQHPIHRFTSGFDYMEAMVKFLGVLSISVLKDADKTEYKEVFFKNFKLSPSLGHYVSLSTNAYKKKTLDFSLYPELRTQLTDDTKPLKLTDPGTLLIPIKKEKTYSTFMDVLNYCSAFRNKTKGHGASFRADDAEQIVLFNDTLRQIVTTLEAKIDEIFELEGLSFEIEPNEESTDNGHTLQNVFALWKGKKISLSPLLIHFTCKSYSCQHTHREKLFFYNDCYYDGTASRYYYIDYQQNHYFSSFTYDEVAKSLQEMRSQSSDSMLTHMLLKSYVGHEKELQEAIAFLRTNVKESKSSSMVIKGKPGIGKSAFIAKLQEALTDDMELPHLSYIFYASKHKTIADAFENISGYLKNNEIKIPSNDLTNKTLHEKFDHAFRALNATPFILMIDGLEDVDFAENLIATLPLEYQKNLHVVFSTREDKRILDALESKLFHKKSTLVVMHAQDYASKRCSFELGGLEELEARSLIKDGLSKDVAKDNDDVREEIINTIYENSKALPLYIRHICENLRNLTFENSDEISPVVQHCAKTLPKEVITFYTQSFQSLKPLSRHIVHTLYFANKPLGFDTLYTLCQPHFETFIDRKEFHYNYFLPLLPFLTHKNGMYAFYHPAIKEAIKQTLDGKSAQDLGIDFEEKLTPLASLFESIKQCKDAVLIQKTVLSDEALCKDFFEKATMEQIAYVFGSNTVELALTHKPEGLES